MDVGTAVSVTGSTAGNDMWPAQDVTYLATGNNNVVTFLDGTNTFVGNTSSGDVVTGGSGFDTIYTGTGASTVFSGAGSDVIVLSNTTGADIAVLGDGKGHVVVANGSTDVVYSSTPGNTIFGGNSTANTTYVAISPSSTAGGAGDDVVVAGRGTTVVFDTAGSNTVYGGSGALYFVGGNAPAGRATVSDTIVSGSGQVLVYGESGANITLDGTSSLNPAYLIAGTGNETLNGAAAGSFAFYGNSAAAATDTVSAIGGSGTDYFITGGGTENLTAGTGTDLFSITTGHAAHINITDFASKDYLQIAGQSAATTAQQLAAALWTQRKLHGHPFRPDNHHLRRPHELQRAHCLIVGTIP